jgi:hypothetical protein
MFAAMMRVTLTANILAFGQCETDIIGPICAEFSKVSEASSITVSVTHNSDCDNVSQVSFLRLVHIGDVGCNNAHDIDSKYTCHWVM